LIVRLFSELLKILSNSLSDRQQPGAFSASRSIPWIIAGKRRRAHRCRRVVRVRTAAGQPGAPAPLKQYIGADRLLSFHRSDSPNQIVLRSRGTREGADTEPTAMASARRVAVASPSPRPRGIGRRSESARGIGHQISLLHPRPAPGRRRHGWRRTAISITARPAR